MVVFLALFFEGSRRVGERVAIEKAHASEEL